MATYYWRGGSGTWDASNTTNWSTSSGGAGGFGPPTREDAVIFDTNSAAGNYTVQVCATSYDSECARITATAPAAGAGNITFSNTVGDNGLFMRCGSPTAALTTTINIYNGAIFTPGASTGIMVIDMYAFASGTSSVTFNSSGAATQPICLFIYQGSNSLGNTLNFCNSTTQTFSAVNVSGGQYYFYPSSATDTFNCTSATISILGGYNGTEFFGFGSLQGNSSGILNLFEFRGNIALTSTSFTIGTAATRASAPYGGAFYIAAYNTAGTLSCSGTSISILRVPTIDYSSNQYYFHISENYTCSTQLANVTLSNGAPMGYGASYYSSFGKVSGLSGNLVVSNTVSNAAGLYLSVYAYFFSNFTIAGTTTITAATLNLNSSTSSHTITHTGAVSLIGSALGMSTYTGVTSGDLTFSSTLTSTNPTSFAASHTIYFASSAIKAAGNVSLVDTTLIAGGITTTGASNTWTHGTVNGIFYYSDIYSPVSLTKGLTTLTNVGYSGTATGTFAALTLSGASFSTYYEIVIIGNVLLSSYSTIGLSGLSAGVFPGTGGISITGTLTSTNAGNVNVFPPHFITTTSGNLSVSSTINLTDAYISINGNVSCTTFTHSNVVSNAVSTASQVDGTFSTTGAISLTKVIYAMDTTVSANSGASNITLTGCSITFYGTITASTLTVANSSTVYSTIDIYAAPTLVNFTSTSSSTGVHVISFLSSGFEPTGAVSLADTQITANGPISCTTYTHSNTAAAAIALTNTFNSPGTTFQATGAINITKATYNVTCTTMYSLTTMTLTGSSLTVVGALAGATVLANSVNVYSALAVNDATSIASLVSTSTGTGAHTTTFLGTFSTTGAVSLVDTTFQCNSTVSVGTTWTQTKTATGTTTSSNVFGGNATFGGNTAFTNSDVVFFGQTNSVTGTFSFTVTSAAVAVSTGYATNDFPALTFLYNGASTLSVSGSFTITGATTNRTNVRTFVPYAGGNQEPENLKYNQVTISVASVSLSYVNFQNVTASGATPWTGTALGNATGNNNITFPAAATRFLVASSGTVQSNTAIWANSSGGATSLNNYPLPQDTIAVDNNSASVGAVTLNFASVIYATNVVGQASINRQVTFSRADRSSLILLGNITIFTPTAGGLVFDLLNITLTNASAASAHILSWPTGYVPLNSNNVDLYPYSLGSTILSGSTSSSGYFDEIKNVTVAPASGSYGSFSVSDGVDLYVYQFDLLYSSSFNFGSSSIYTNFFRTVNTVATTSYTLSSAPAVFGGVMSGAFASYIGTLNVLTLAYYAVNVGAGSIGTLNISVYNPINVESYLQISSCTVGNMTGGGTNSSNQVYLYGYAGPATLTKSGGGFVQLNYVRPFNLSAAPANTFYATNSSLAPSGTATGWTFTAAPTATAGGNFFLEF